MPKRRRRKVLIPTGLVGTSPETSTVFLSAGAGRPGRDDVVQALHRASVNIEDVRRQCDGSRLLMFAPPHRIPQMEMPNLLSEDPATLVCLSLSECDETWESLRDRLGSDPQFDFQEMRRSFDRGNVIIILDADDGTSWMGVRPSDKPSHN